MLAENLPSPTGDAGDGPPWSGCAKKKSRGKKISTQMQYTYDWSLGAGVAFYLCNINELELNIINADKLTLRVPNASPVT